jgi:hypothetical protein
MFTTFASRLATPLIAGLFAKRSKLSLAEGDLQALLARMRHRLYPETIPVLASYWLKTVYARGYSLRRWKELNRLLKLALAEPLPAASREAIIDIQNWIQEPIVVAGQTPASGPPRLRPVRASFSSGQLTAHIVRLLNQWLPVEVARLLDQESESSVKQDGIPVLAIGRALERLLVREHLSQATLEMLLEPELVSPGYVYPADVEILRDVVLSLLDRTWITRSSVMPATLLCVAPDSHLPADHREALRDASLVQGPQGEEVHVPIAPARALEILKDERVQIGSIIVTMDGRSWESETLQSGEQYSVVYRPIGRLRIDYSGDHARLRVPWPGNRLHWSGGGYSRDIFNLFGREWRVSKWEVDADRTWLHLVFSRMLPISEILPVADMESWRLRPASVDMAWAALESALTSSLVQRSGEPIEQLRHSDLIPLGRAIATLTELVTSRQPRIYETIETRLKAIRYLESPIVSAYGRVPWRILPAPVRATFLRVRRHPVLLELLNEVFEGLPEALSQVTDRSAASRSTSPPHAA